MSKESWSRTVTVQRNDRAVTSVQPTTALRDSVSALLEVRRSDARDGIALALAPQDVVDMDARLGRFPVLCAIASPRQSELVDDIMEIDVSVTQADIEVPPGPIDQVRGRC